MRSTAAVQGEAVSVTATVTAGMSAGAWKAGRAGHCSRARAGCNLTYRI